MQQHTPLDEQGSLPASLPPINQDDYEVFSKSLTTKSMLLLHIL